MNVALFDHPQLRQQLLPFTYTRPVADIRMGILTITEKWEHYLRNSVSFITEPYLSKKFTGPSETEDLVLINGGVCPDTSILEAIKALTSGQALYKDDLLIAAKADQYESLDDVLNFQNSEYADELTIVSRPWHIFKEAGQQIRLDYKLLTENKTSASIDDPHTIVYGAENIFLEDGVSIKAATLNAENGPIYLGKNSVIEEGAIVRGPFSLGEESTINAQARMRGDISIGPKCKVGGEVSNSVIFSHTNKGHDGFLGNSVLGEWCNIGADTNASNLKNNYTNVKVWDFAKEGFVDTKEQFCGLFMADHGKCGINTMFNTGTVVGVAANVFGSGFPRTYIPSFSWGGHAGFSTFKPLKVKEMAAVSMARRGGVFDDVEEGIMNHIFEETKKYRTWEG